MQQASRDAPHARQQDSRRTWLSDEAPHSSDAHSFEREGIRPKFGR